MTTQSQQRATRSFRKRLLRKGLVRFEVVARGSDRELVKRLTRRLAEDNPDSNRLRASIEKNLDGTPSQKGGIVRALLASPLVGSELDLTRLREQGRKIDL